MIAGHKRRGAVTGLRDDVITSSSVCNSRLCRFRDLVADSFVNRSWRGSGKIKRVGEASSPRVSGLRVRHGKIKHRRK